MQPFQWTCKSQALLIISCKWQEGMFALVSKMQLHASQHSQYYSPCYGIPFVIGCTLLWNFVYRCKRPHNSNKRMFVCWLSKLTVAVATVELCIIATTFQSLTGCSTSGVFKMSTWNDSVIEPTGQTYIHWEPCYPCHVCVLVCLHTLVCTVHNMFMSCLPVIWQTCHVRSSS